MSPETNKAIVRRMVGQVWNKRRIDLIEEFYTEDVIQHLTGRPSITGLEAVRSATIRMLSAYPDLEHAIEDQIAEGDKVVSRWRMTSSHPGGLDSNTAPGKRLIQSGVTIFHLSNARVDEFWLLSDNLELLRELGFFSTDTT